MIPRSRYFRQLVRSVENNPITAILGPRQCGKTTLAKLFAETQVNLTYFDLEDPVDRVRLSAPQLALAPLNGLIVIDEIQRKPEIFPLLRVLADRINTSSRFLILGSASPWLVRDASESLAGRVGFVDIGGFTLEEVGVQSTMDLWQRGGFPRSFLSSDDEASLSWRDSFARTFLERDLPQLGISVPSETLRRFWTMVAHYHGQLWNAAEFARSLGSSEATARRYLDILTGAYVVRQLVPWFENMKKRQVKAPKVYIRDTGLLHSLLSIGTYDELSGHPKIGASWEGFVVEQLFALTHSRDIYFWATHSGAELDVLYMKGGKRHGIEIKFSDAPRTTRSMRSCIETLDLESLSIVYPGAESYQLDERISAVSIRDFPKIVEDL